MQRIDIFYYEFSIISIISKNVFKSVNNLNINLDMLCILYITFRFFEKQIDIFHFKKILYFLLFIFFLSIKIISFIFDFLYILCVILNLCIFLCLFFVFFSFVS